VRIRGRVSRVGRQATSRIRLEEIIWTYKREKRGKGEKGKEKGKRGNREKGKRGKGKGERGKGKGKSLKKCVFLAAQEIRGRSQFNTKYS